MERIFKVSRREKGIRNVYLVAFFLLLICFFINLYANRELVRQSERVEHTNNVIKTLDNLLAKVVDGETGMRGYMLSKDIGFLFPYYGSEEIANSLYKNAKSLLTDNPGQEQRLDTLKKLIDRRFQILALNLDDFNKQNRTVTDSLLARQRIGKSLMNEIRSTTSLMEREEDRLLVERAKRMKNTTDIITAITIISLGLVFSLLIFGFMTYMQVSKQRKNAEEDIFNFQQQLKTRIADLDEANTELIKMRSLEKFAVTGRIARTIGHEVRNPLTNIMLAADQLKLELGQPEKDKTYLFNMIDRNIGRINQLISDLLDSTKTSELNFEKIKLKSLLEETIREAKDRMELTNVALETEFDIGGNCEIAVDKSKMKIALLNIITNALEAMHGKTAGLLRITTNETPSRCEILIKDNGPGMDLETAGKIFEPYYTTKKTGNGLGMTNTQNIIVNHKGDLSVETKPGAGATFKISIKKI